MWAGIVLTLISSILHSFNYIISEYLLVKVDQPISVELLSTLTGNSIVHTYYIHNMYVHTYIYTYILTQYIHIYIHTFIHTYIHIYVHSYIHSYIHTFIHSYIHSYIHTHMR